MLSIFVSAHDSLILNLMKVLENSNSNCFLLACYPLKDPVELTFTSTLVIIWFPSLIFVYLPLHSKINSKVKDNPVDKARLKFLNNSST